MIFSVKLQRLFLTMVFSNNINVKFIFLFIFFLELKYVLSYSSNIYFFFIFFIVSYIFFIFFTKVFDVYNINYEVRLVIYTLYNLIHLNKAKYSLLQKLLFYNSLIQYYIYLYKLIISEKLIILYGNVNSIFVLLKHYFINS